VTIAGSGQLNTARAAIARRVSPRWRLTLAVLGLVAVLRLPSFAHQLYDVDEASIATQGMVIRNGGTLYEQAVDRKPPLVPLIYAAVFKLTGSDDLRPLHVLVAFGFVACGLLAASEARRLALRRRRNTAHPARRARTRAADGDADASRRSAWWAAALVVTGLVSFLPDAGQAANFSHFAVIPGMVAIVAARRGTWRSALVAGLALGLAVLCRQTWLLGIPAACVGCALFGRSRHLAPLAVGLAMPFGVIAGVVPFGDFVHWAFTGTGGYVTAGTTVLNAMGQGSLSVLLVVAGHLALGWQLALRASEDLTLVRALRNRPPGLAAVGRAIDIDLWLWLAAGLVAAVLGLRFYGHYWLQSVPPAGLLAASAARASPRHTRALQWALALPAAAAVGLACLPWPTTAARQTAALVAYVRDHTTPDQAVMVWGNLPEVTWEADRPLGGGLVDMDFVTGLSGGRRPGLDTLVDATGGAQDKLLQQLAQRPPELILDTSTANLHDYGAYPISAFPRVEAIVQAHYQPAAIVDRVVVYRLRS
jgi:hypothetical protein